MLVYLCPSCSSQVKKPGQMGHSWCSKCEIYQPPIAEDVEEGGELETEIEEEPSAVWVYTAWTPKPNSIAIDERVDHKFAYTKRTDRLRKGITQFRARCTCKKLKDTQWKSTKRQARLDWQSHMCDVEQQQMLPI